MLSSTPAEMDVNKENSGEESPTDWILNLDFNPERVMLHLNFKRRRNLCQRRRSGKPVSSRNVDPLSHSRRGKRQWCSCDNCQEKYAFPRKNPSSRVVVILLKKTAVPTTDSFRWMTSPWDVYTANCHPRWQGYSPGGPGNPPSRVTPPIM